MGINYILFDDVDSRNYNIEVFFNDIDRTPKRVYTRVDVAGRNGSILLDEGRYEDVPITYDCIALDDADRRDFVNALASKVGYFRLSDSFNTDEYYSAVFDGDIEPRLTPERDKSTFSIYFTRYPQRYLTSGETELTVTSGQTINNPTPFDAKPLVMVHGYGTLGIGDYVIELDGGLIGTVSIKSGTWAYVAPNPCVIDYSALPINQGDSITIDSVTVRNGVYPKSPLSISSIDGQSTTAYSDIVMCDFGSVNLTAFPNVNSTQTLTTSRSYGLSNGVSFSVTLSATITNAPSGKITVSTSFTASADVSQYVKFIDGLGHGTITYINNVTADSTVTSIGDPTYIDCDIGEAYLIDGDGNVVSLNSLIELGSDLPVLSPGDTTITYDNTITAVEIIPRWWIL